MTTDPLQRLQAARDAAAQGRYAEALREHQWFHQHALAIEPALYGVRLSFALSYWIELARAYPPAMAALLAIRDRDEHELRSGRGTRTHFHDATRINAYLDQRDRNPDLFRRVLERDESLARACAAVALPDLIAAGDHQLAARFLPDSRPTITRQAQRLNARVRELRELPVADRPGVSFQLATRFLIEARRFAEVVEQHRAVLANTGHRPAADELRETALASIEDPSMREKTSLLLS